MSELTKKFLSWWQDGVSFKETIALIIISIFGYSIYIACKKMMSVGLDVNDIELFKIISVQIVIILCFYFGGSSAENIVQYIFRSKILKKNINNNNYYNEEQNYGGDYNSRI